MATFVLFGNYSMDAIEDISSRRTEEAQKIIAEAGGKVIASYALLGEIDLVLVLDLPDVQSAMKVSVELSNLTEIAFTTCPAISIDEFDRLFV